MYKIVSVKFKHHPVLGDLYLDFRGPDGTAVDTVIFAGENGVGKSTVLDCLYKIASKSLNFEVDVEIDEDGTSHVLKYFNKTINNETYIWVQDESGWNTLPGHTDFNLKYNFNGIYSDVDINFHSKKITSVTSLELDEKKESRRSSNELPTQINQLLIDIQALDDADIAFAVRQHPELLAKDILVGKRMQRFTTAFNRMFDCLSYSRINNQDGYKSIQFSKYGIEIPIDVLSSGEKQIVYRGCFLLKDAYANSGVFVFIDEPEISLHPTWQMKIMDYYKSLFTNESNVQTSQIFAVTHSPFIIHNNNRRNDKIIVLSRDEHGNIIVKDKPEYFKCTSLEAIQDAFSIQGFSSDRPTVYLEGRTDEKYFNKALEVYGYDVPFQFQWVGYMKDEKNEENTGKDALNKAAQFLAGRNLSVKNVCLFDCDTNRAETSKNNVYIRVIPTYTSAKHMKKGIENALILDSVDISPYYSSKIKKGDYGDDSTIVEFKKMEFCDYICSLDTATLKSIFSNLQTVIDSLVTLYKDC